MHKRLIVIVLILAISFILAVGFGFMYIWTMPNAMTIADLAGEGLLYNSYYFNRSPVLMFNAKSESGRPQVLHLRDGDKVKRFLDLIKNKRATRLSDAGYEKIDPFEREALDTRFDEKLTCLRVLGDGRIMFSVPTSHYRGKSRLHWLRWKIDGFGTRYTGVPYIAEPDSAVIKEARGLFQAAKPR